MYTYKESFICTYYSEETATDVINIVRLNIPQKYVRIKQYQRNKATLRIDFVVKAETQKSTASIAHQWRLLLIEAIVHPNIKTMEVNGFPTFSGR